MSAREDGQSRLMPAARRVLGPPGSHFRLSRAPRKDSRVAWLPRSTNLAVELQNAVAFKANDSTDEASQPRRRRGRLKT